MKATVFLNTLFVFLFGLLSTVAATDQPWTVKHEQGRCAIRGHCGKQGFFGSQLPCPDNGLAEKPSPAARAKLVDICGEKWSEGAVCCQEDQVRMLQFHDTDRAADLIAFSLKRSSRI